MIRRTFLATTAALDAAAAAATAASAATGSPTHTHATAPTRFVEAGGVRFAYRRFGRPGSQPPLVLLMHFIGNMDNWDPTITDGFAREREVILFDNTGVGATSGSVPDSIEQMSRDAASFVTALGLSQIDLLGFSMGGLLAQQVAIDHPQLVRRLILVGTGPRSGEGMAAQTAESQAVFSAQYEHPDDLWLAVFFTQSPESQAAGRAFLKRFRARIEGRDIEVDGAKVAPAQLSAIATWGAPKPDPYAYLRAVQQPTLVVNGDHDIIIQTINSLILKDNIPNAHLVIYPDASHGSLFQYPDRFLRDSTMFLNRT